MVKSPDKVNVNSMFLKQTAFYLSIFYQQQGVKNLPDTDEQKKNIMLIKLSLCRSLIAKLYMEKMSQKSEPLARTQSLITSDIRAARVKYSIHATVLWPPPNQDSQITRDFWITLSDF